jgi:hypothetical protein
MRLPGFSQAGRSGKDVAEKMRTGSSRVAAGAAVAAILSLVPVTALADLTKAQCIEANTKGQDLRRDGKFSSARKELVRCTDPSCPSVVRDDCTRRLDDIDKVQPTIVFIAKDASGKDVSAVKVTMDGQPLADGLDGTELPVDPGRHVFTFAAAGLAPVSMTLVLAAGEKDRREHIVVGGGVATAPVGGATPAAPPPAGRSHLSILSDSEATISVDGTVVGKERFDGTEAPGPHEVSVTGTGMKPYKAEIDLREGETRTLQITLEAERHGSLWPWIVGGAAVLAGGAVGGYFLFKPSDHAATLGGEAATVQFSAFGGGK